MPFLKLIVDGKVVPSDLLPPELHLCRNPLPNRLSDPDFDVGTIWQCPVCSTIWEWRLFDHPDKKGKKIELWHEVKGKLPSLP